jgi:hypothetical protein
MFESCLVIVRKRFNVICEEFEEFEEFDIVRGAGRRILKIGNEFWRLDSYSF